MTIHAGSTIQVCLVSGPTAGFSAARVRAIAQTFEVKVPSETNPTQVIKNFIHASEKVKRRVVACFVPGCAEGAYVDHSVTSISDDCVQQPLIEVLVKNKYRPQRTAAPMQEKIKQYASPVLHPAYG